MNSQKPPAPNPKHALPVSTMPVSMSTVSWMLSSHCILWSEYFVLPSQKMLRMVAEFSLAPVGVPLLVNGLATSLCSSLLQTRLDHYSF